MLMRPPLAIVAHDASRNSSRKATIMNLQRLLRLKDGGVIQSVVVAIAKSKGGPAGISVTVAGEYSEPEEARLKALVSEESEAGDMPVYVRFEPKARQ
jgi:hypothetical protein